MIIGLKNQPGLQANGQKDGEATALLQRAVVLNPNDTSVSKHLSQAAVLNAKASAGPVAGRRIEAPPFGPGVSLTLIFQLRPFLDSSHRHIAITSGIYIPLFIDLAFNRLHEPWPRWKQTLTQCR